MRKLILLFTMLFTATVFGQFAALIENERGDEVPGATVDYSFDNATTYANELDVSPQNSAPEQIMQRNGKFYMTSSSVVYQYSEGANIDNATYDAVSGGVSQMRTGAQWSDDGTILGSGNFSGPNLRYRDVGTPFTPGTFSNDTSLGNITTITESRGWVWFNDGSVLWALDNTSLVIRQYTYSGSAWTSSVTEDIGVTLDISAHANIPAGLTISPDGRWLAYCNRGSDSVDMWYMATPHDLPNAVFHVNYDINAETQTPYDLVYSEDGTRIYVLDTGQDEVLQIDLNNMNNLYASGDAATPALNGGEAGNVGSWYGSGGGDAVVSLNSSDYYDGEYSIQIENGAGVQALRGEYDFNLEDGETYDITIWCKSVTGAEQAFTAWIGFSNFSSKQIDVNSNDWEKYTWTGLVASGTPQKIRAYPSSNS